ncbi:MAG TPA: alpha-amylase family glycosyl hydrolase [Solirubrobacteraceae bacterium]|nr:alpha-amylase family glycosyl hydrolase [Solirubrobacteraceae bacterium]
MSVEPTTAAEPEHGAAAVAPSWWRDGVLYQIYPRSFADSDGDGIGDLRGAIGRLDHLEWLGIDGIWLNPTMPSPNDDWGYDVADYCTVHPDLGTLADLEELVAEAGTRGIRVLLDLVPNHTSDRHAWFQEALGDPGAPHRDFYVWADPRPDGSPPNNWQSSFGGSAWSLDEASGQFYLHNFLPSQPDLNWWNEDVRVAFDDILRFWFHRGVAGFRIDVCHAIVKDRELRDDPAATPKDHPFIKRRGLQQVFSMNRPEVHDVLRRWRTLAEAQEPKRILVGETYVLDLDHLIPFYGKGEDELNLAFNFLFVHAALDATAMREIVEAVEARLQSSSWPVWTGSNHDAGRLATRWADGDPARARLAMVMLLTLRGTPFLYYGDEIGLADVPLDPDKALDPVPRRTGDPDRNRDPCRTPMQWTGAPGAGFTDPAASPWLPFGDPAACNVADQREEPGSQLHLVRDLIALRRARSELRSGTYRTLPAPDGAWAFRRGDAFAVALNLADGERSLERVQGTVAIATDRSRDGESVAGTLTLAPWQAAVVDLRA